MGSLIANIMLGLKKTCIKDITRKQWICELPVKEKILPNRPRSDCCGPIQPIPKVNLDRTTLEIARPCQEADIKSFFWSDYWGREPSTTGMYMNFNSPYLKYLTCKYASQGDRILCYEEREKPKYGRRLIGIAVGEKSFPWTPDELEAWSVSNSRCQMQVEADHLSFMAHCMRGADLFKKYNVPYVYDIKALGTAHDVMGFGLGSLLFRAIVVNAMELRHPMIQVIATNAFMAKICERLKMKKEYTMQYVDVSDYKGRPVFFPRKPHYSVSVYSRKFDPMKGAVPDHCTEPELYYAFLKMKDKKPLKRLKPKGCLTDKDEYYP